MIPPSAHLSHHTPTTDQIMNTPTNTPADPIAAAKKEMADAQAAAAITAQAVRTAENQYAHADGAYYRGHPSRPEKLTEAAMAITEAKNAHSKTLDRLQAAEAGLVAAERRVEQEKVNLTAPKAPTAEEEEADFTAAREDLATATRAWHDLRAKREGIETELAAAVIEREDLLKSQAPVDRLAPALSSLAGKKELLENRLKEAREHEVAAQTVQKRAGNQVRGHVNTRIKILSDVATAAQHALRDAAARSPLMALSARLQDAKTLADGEVTLKGFEHGEALLEAYEIIAPRLSALAMDTRALAEEIREKVGVFAERAEHALEERSVA